MQIHEFQVSGHPNITATHKSTLEFTKENNVTLRGDCILGVSATTSLYDLPEEMKQAIQKGNEMEVELLIDGEKIVIKGRGHKNLLLSNKQAMVIRKSEFTCPRTLMIDADAAAKDIPNSVLAKMKNPNKTMIIKIYVLDSTQTSTQA